MHLVNELLSFTYTAKWVIQTLCLLKQMWLHTLNSVSCVVFFHRDMIQWCAYDLSFRSVLHSKIGGTYNFSVSCSPPQYTAGESCNLNSAVCASETGVERMWQRVCSSAHLLQHCMFSTTRLFQKKWEKISNIHMWNAHRGGGWGCVSPPSSKTLNKITILN